MEQPARDLDQLSVVFCSQHPARAARTALILDALEQLGGVVGEDMEAKSTLVRRPWHPVIRRAANGDGSFRVLIFPFPFSCNFPSTLILRATRLGSTANTSPLSSGGAA